MNSEQHLLPFLERIARSPQRLCSASPEAEHQIPEWAKQASGEAGIAAARVAKHPGGQALLLGIFSHSPYLSQLLHRQTDFFLRLCAADGDGMFDDLLDGVRAARKASSQAELMHELRMAKERAALLIAVADITGLWPLPKVTGALSAFAEHCLCAAVDWLLASAASRGEIGLANLDVPSQGSGLIVLGMGKLGGGELNYSSDIDLILLFERGRTDYRGRYAVQHFYSRLAQDLVHIMQERTRDGYVFRTDLRLRPDPASTAPALSTDAALAYYESVGQNWERAAMIKARPVAGDREAGEAFLRRLVPYLWRKSLDFAAINDIQSIKRQMDSRGAPSIRLPGHNIKIGRGGIREIEFLAQIHQLIWGGRKPALRLRSTCETLETLVSEGLMDAGTAAMLRDAYWFYRKVEHRLQMVADQQTHTLPESREQLEKLAQFCGFAETGAFEHELLNTLSAVHRLFASSFQSAGNLGDDGNLVFTGVSHDPETLRTLRAMGYADPEKISETVQGWHHGVHRATRTKRARELLTELMPLLLRRFAATANPDAAFLNFNEFLSRLPAGVQLFSLFAMNPHLLELIADIMGSAPTLAETLGKHPELLDAVLSGDFYAQLPVMAELERQLDGQLALAKDYEDIVSALRRFKNEKLFQAGVHLLKDMVDSARVSLFLSDMAELVLNRAYQAVAQEFARSYGTIPGSGFAMLLLGRLGSREMTFISDLDLVLVYDCPIDAVSGGAKPLNAQTYFIRLGQRLIGALSSLTREGRLYEVDTRLRPSGEQGLLAVAIDALRRYFEESAWTFEFMALTRARALSGDAALAQKLERFVHAQLKRPRDTEILLRDVRDMRRRIAAEHPARGRWDIKHTPGGLTDLDFIAQALLLRHAHALPALRTGSAAELFTLLEQGGKLTSEEAARLRNAHAFLTHLFSLLRLCADDLDIDRLASPGLRQLLARSLRFKDFDTLAAALEDTLRYVANIWRGRIELGTEEC